MKDTQNTESPVLEAIGNISEILQPIILQNNSNKIGGLAMILTKAYITICQKKMNGESLLDDEIEFLSSHLEKFYSEFKSILNRV